MKFGNSLILVYEFQIKLAFNNSLSKPLVLDVHKNGSVWICK